MRGFARPLLLFVLAAAASAQKHTHGDMVGELGPTQALVWTRASASAQVRVVWSRSADMAEARATEPVGAKADTDYCVQVWLGRLRPDTQYWFATELRGVSGGSWVRGPIGTFRTPPPPTEAASVTFGFSADVAIASENDIFAKLAAHRPRFYVSLGDYPYADGAKTLADYRRKHRDTRADPQLHEFFRRVPIEPVWDDHEVHNDWDARIDAGLVANGLAAWREYMPVDSERARIWRSVRWGSELELFLLDCRSHRGLNAAPDLPGKTMLGAEQKRWLLESLTESTATFKVVCTSVPLRFGTTGRDHWRGYQRERAEILAHLRDRRVANVVFLSADQHWAASHHHAEGVREFQAGPMSMLVRQPIERADPMVRFLAAERSYGIVRVDADRGELIVELHGMGGLLHHEVLRDEQPAQVSFDGDRIGAGVALRGPQTYSLSGRRAALPSVAPGSYRVVFDRIAESAARPSGLELDVPAGGQVAIAASWAEPARRTLLAEEFDRRPACITIDQPGANGNSAWFVDAGRLWQSSNMHGGEAAAIDRAGTLALFGRRDLRDYEVGVRVWSDDDDAVALVFRCRDPRNHYRFELDRQRRERRLVRLLDGEATVLATDRWMYERRTWYRLRCIARGDQLTALVDDEPVFVVSDSALRRGGVGLWTWGNETTAFDDLVARELADPSVRGRVLARDAFGDGRLGRWTTVDVGEQKTASRWAEKRGGLRELAGTGAEPGGADKSDLAGTIATFGKAGWTNYRASASVRVDAGGVVGIVFRYVGPSDHYRLLWGAAFRRLERVVAGHRHTLHEDTVGWRRGLMHRVTCQAEGFRLRAWVDGELFCDVLDGAHEHGKIGMFAWRSPGVMFDDVLVEQPVAIRASLAGIVHDGSLRGVGRCPAGAGSVYVLAPSDGLAPDPLGVFGLRAGQLLFTGLAATRKKLGLVGVVGPRGEISARIDVPAVASVHGRAVLIGGIAIDPTGDRVLERLPVLRLPVR